MGSGLLQGCALQTVVPLETPVQSDTVTPLPSSTPLPTRIVTLLPAVTATKTVASSPTLDASTIVESLKIMEAEFNQKVLQAKWTRTVHENVYFDNNTGKYRDILIDEQWNTYVNGELLEAYHWTTNELGILDQESVWLEGQFVNLTFGSRPRGSPKKVRPEYYYGMVQYLGKCIERGDPVAQVEENYEDHLAWKFTCQVTELVNTFQQFLYLDQKTGYPLAKGMNIVLPEGSLKLVSGVVNIQLELGADPPLERFKRMKRDAEAIP